MNFGDMVKEAGPYTGPLCIAMISAIGWLLKQLTASRKAEKEARDDATQLREKRAEDLERAAKEYAAAGEAMRVAMREWTTSAETILKLVRRGSEYD